MKNRINSGGYGYDANGNMTNDGQNTLVYDGENRLTSSSGPVGSGTYTYDGRGLRVKKVSGSTTTVYIFSGSKVIAEYDNGAAPAAPSREYIYAGGALLAKIDASGTRYYQRDHLSNRLITDSSGNILAQLGHSPFGESWYNATNEKWLFTTYERDAESANDYAMARYDASRLGRFLSPDPAAGGISDPQSWNRYSYAHNDPINLVDPSGMFVAPQIYALMLFYHVPMFGSLWNEFDILKFAFTPTASYQIPVTKNNEPLWETVDEYGNLGVLSLLFGGGAGGVPDPCQGVAQGKTTYINAYVEGKKVARLRFDGNGLLSGVTIPDVVIGGNGTNLGGILGEVRVNTVQTTTVGLAWTNGPLPGSFAFEASAPISASYGSQWAAISSLTFNGSFHVNGDYNGIPGTSGLLEWGLNSNFSAVVAATDFANKLASSKIPCTSIFPRIRK